MNTQEAFKMTWRAKTKEQMTLALDEMERCLNSDCEILTIDEFDGFQSLVRAKAKQLKHKEWSKGL